MRLALIRLLIGTVLLLFLAVGLFVSYFIRQLTAPSGPITVSAQTTVLTTPLAADGLPDYAKALLDEMREGVTPENNGAIPFLKAMWPAQMDPAQQRAVCAELGMEMPESDGMREPDSDKQLNEDLLEQRTVPEQAGTEQHAYYGILDWAQSHPWTGSEIPLLADWVDKHASHYDLLHQAASKPKFYLPSASLLTDPNCSLILMMMPEIQSTRAAARCLLTRANYHLGKGDPAAAWRDCRAVYQLAEKVPRTTLISELVSVAVEGMAHSCTLRILDDPSLSPEVAQKMLDYLKRKPPRKSMAGTIDRGERIGSVTAIIEMCGERKSDDPDVLVATDQLGPLKPLAQAAMDWDRILQIMNEWYDKLAEAAKIPNWKDRQEALDAVETELAAIPGVGPGAVVGSVFSRKARSENIGNVMVTLLLPALSSAIKAEDRANTQLLLHQTAAALALYRLDDGDYPGALGSLVPEYLDAVPVDLFHANPLVYRKAEEGYLLYSLGPNGTDDGGSSS